MSLLYRFKPFKDRAMRPACRALLSAGVTPNTVTTAGLFLSGAAGLVAAYGHLHAGIALFAVGACLDAVDGSLARNLGLGSEFGLYFDSVSDRLSETVFIAGAIAGGVPATAALVIAGSVLLLASRVHNHRKGLSSDAAIIGRPERLALLVAGMVVASPGDSVLFATNALLCLASSLRVIASGAGTGRGRDRSA